MQFLNFKEHFNKFILFSIREIEKQYPGFNKMNLLSWQKKGYIQKLRNGWYCFTDLKTDEDILFLIANKIYKPSYISLESALFYHGLIPEAVFSITSISTLKTKTFKNKLHFYSYTGIKKSCFFGYELIQKDNYTFKIACPEKSLLDYLYIQTSVRTIDDIEALRLNKERLHEILDFQKLSDYANAYKSKVLLKKIKKLNHFLNA